jgi:ribosomal protein L11 methyltransferase
VPAPALTVRFPSDDSSLRDHLAAEVDGTGATAIDDRSDLEWRIFYGTSDVRDAALRALDSYAREHGVTLASLEVEDEDWARRSQAQLTAVRVGDIIVAPPWDVPALGTHQAPGTYQAPGTLTHQAPGTGHQAPIVIVIEPSLGFGTGHHASTRLCLRAMQGLDLRGKSVIDVGTGSGVLAIAAAKRGASRVSAIDTDPDAVASARENGARNDVVVDWHVADVAALSGRNMFPAYDVVLANLTGAWLRRLTESLLGLTGAAGVLVLSGLQTTERDRVFEPFARSSRLERELDEEGWTALVIVHN